MYAQSKGLFDVTILAAAVESIILVDTVQQFLVA
jgi:hypothetical protein